MSTEAEHMPVARTRGARRPVIAGLIALVAVTIAAGVALSLHSRAPAPSARCQRQVTAVAVAQAEGRAALDAGQYDTAQADILAAHYLLTQVKAEGCPGSGYAHGVTIGGGQS